MRASLLAYSLLSLLSIPTFALPSDEALEPRNGRLMKRADDPVDKVDSATLSTTFNGIEVPPMKELTPENFEETVKDGYWLEPSPHWILTA
jgi:protein disulfide-isomerase